MVKNILLILISQIFMFAFMEQIFAYQIQDLPEVEVKGDIVLSPTKVELFMDPGEKIGKEIMITNRTGNTVNFSIGIEDFKGSRDINQPIIFLGKEKDPYSLKDLISPEIRGFTLRHGQRIYIPVEVSIPLDADSGGRYGVVFAVIKPDVSTAAEANAGQVAIVARAGVLFFVRVNGDTKEEGSLKDFQISKKFYEKGPILFDVLFENNGSVHLSPYGTIEITNLLGGNVGKIELDPWFVMPDSLRLREAVWEGGFLFGKYTATVTVSRGYRDIIDQKSISFWVIPWKIVMAGIVVLFLVVWFFGWIFSKFEFRRKT
ncbi:MAG: hypothetical protein ABH813_00020 [Patescibacteria group bacterium]